MENIHLYIILSNNFTLNNDNFPFGKIKTDIELLYIT